MQKPFNERAASRLEVFARDLLETTPELEAMNIALTYKPALGEVTPQFMGFSGVEMNPILQCRMCLQTIKMLLAQMEVVAKDFSDAISVREQLQKEIDEKRKEAAKGHDESENNAIGRPINPQGAPRPS